MTFAEEYPTASIEPHPVCGFVVMVDSCMWATGLSPEAAMQNAERKYTSGQRVGCTDLQCTCYTDCREDSYSGRLHQHEDEPCPAHFEDESPIVG